MTYKKFIYSVLCFLLSVEFSSSAFANTEDFQNLSNDELIKIHQKALERIDIIDDFNEAIDGRAPESSSDILQAAYENFVNTSKSWAGLTRLNTKDESCNRYVSNVRRTLTEINKSYIKTESLEPTSEEFLIQRARIEALTLFLAGELSLALDDSEGGTSVILEKGRTCDIPNRSQWKTETRQLKNVSVFLSSEWFGKRGLRNSFPISRPLLRDLNHDARTKAAWAIPKFTLESVVAFLLMNLLTRIVFPEINLAISPWARGLVQGAGVALSAAYGAYRGYRYVGDHFQSVPNMGDPWTQLQYATEQVLNLKTSNTRAYYEMSYQMEEGVLRLNQSLIRALTPQIEIAKSRFGSLEAAKNLASVKRDEIQTVMAERHLSDSQLEVVKR